MEGKLLIMCNGKLNGRGSEVVCECNLTGTERERDLVFDVVCRALQIEIDDLAKAIRRKCNNLDFDSVSIFEVDSPLAKKVMERENE